MKEKDWPKCLICGSRLAYDVQSEKNPYSFPCGHSQREFAPIVSNNPTTDLEQTK